MYEHMLSKGSETDSLIGKIAHNMRDVAFLKLQLMVFERNPKDYSVIDKKFYSEELITLVDIYTKRYSEKYIFEDLAKSVMAGKVKMEEAVAEVDAYNDAVENFKQVVKNELEAENNTDLQM